MPLTLIFCLCLGLQGLPQNGQPATVVLYGCILITMGVLKVWAAPACNNPVFAEIVPPHLRNLIYAFDRCFEGAVAACATPFVGLLAERIFGFTVVAHTAGDMPVLCPWSQVLAQRLLGFTVCTGSRWF